MERTRLTLFVLVLLLPVLLMVGVSTAVFPPRAHATPANNITVITLNDSGAGSLRQAIADVDTGGTIDFDISGTIVLASELVIDQDLTIQGNIPITISGNNTTRVFNVTAGHVTFDSLTIISGTVQTDDCGGVFITQCGGGIMLQNSDVAVTVTHSSLSGNSAGYGAGIANLGTLTINNSTLFSNSADYGGGIFNNDSLTVINSILTGNSGKDGGGIYTTNGLLTVVNSTFEKNIVGNAGGGIANYHGTLTVNNSTFSDNSAPLGGGIYNNDSMMTVTYSTFSGNLVSRGGGIYNNDSTAAVTHSTFSGNEVSRGGGIYNSGGTLTVTNSTFTRNDANWGGGIYNNESTVTVRNSTLTNNSAFMGGGIYANTVEGTCHVQPHTLIHNSTLSGNLARSGGGGIRNQKGVVEISNSTITTNTAVSGGGVWSRNNGITCTRIGSTIIAGNSGADVTADDTIQRFFSLGHNLIGTAGENIDFTQEFTATGDMTNTLPLLAPLADNGGPTLTHMPLPDSPALDAGNCTSGPATDQRGVARPQNETCDIGAVEMVLDSVEMIYLPLVVR